MKPRSLMSTIVVAVASVASAQPQVPPTPAAPAAKTRIAVAPKAAVMPVMAWGEMSGSYLGVDIEEITSERMRALKLKEERGVEITMVDQDAPAAKAGFKEHDVVLDFNGQRVEGREQFTRFIRETPAGRTVTLGIVRDGQPMQIKATLGDRKEAMKKAYPYRMERMPRVPQPPTVVVPDIDFDMPAIDIVVPSTATGVVLDNLTPQLAQYFGVKNGQGVLVKSVERGSVAEKGGIKAGDVIVKVDNETIESRSDYRQAVRHRDGASIKVVVLRDKKEQTLTLTLPAPRKESSWQEPALPHDFDMQLGGDLEDDLDGDADLEDMPALSHMSPAFEMVIPEIAIPAEGADIAGIRDAVRRMPSDAPACEHELR